jgi:hypothetical protein
MCTFSADLGETLACTLALTVKLVPQIAAILIGSLHSFIELVQIDRER